MYIEKDWKLLLVCPVCKNTIPESQFFVNWQGDNWERFTDGMSPLKKFEQFYMMAKIITQQLSETIMQCPVCRGVPPTDD